MFLQQRRGASSDARKARRRLVDVDLRRGRVRCAEHGDVAPAAARRAAARARSGSCAVPRAARSSTPIPTSEAKPLNPTSVYAVTKRDHEEMCLVVGRAYGIPTVALRFFNIYGSRQALSNPYTGVAAIFASRLLNGQRAAGLRGRTAGARLRPRLGHRHGDPAGARLRAGRRQARQPRHGPPVDRARRRRRASRRARRRARARSSPDSFRAGDIRHCYGDPSTARELLGFEAQVSLEDGMA